MIFYSVIYGTIIHNLRYNYIMTTPSLDMRRTESRIAEALLDTPVVLVT